MLLVLLYNRRHLICAITMLHSAPRRLILLKRSTLALINRHWNSSEFQGGFAKIGLTSSIKLKSIDRAWVDSIKILICKCLAVTWIWLKVMMTSSNGSIFRAAGPLAGNSPDPGEFPSQRPVTRSFDVFFDLRLNKRLSKQSRRRGLETPSRSLWRQCSGKRNSHPNNGHQATSFRCFCYPVALYL